LQPWVAFDTPRKQGEPLEIERLDGTRRQHRDGLTEEERALAAGSAVGSRAAALTLEQVNDFVRRFYDPAGFTMIRARPD
jgi:hypothetical protein